ncbi:tRNA ligase subunit PheS family protein [Streptomyces zagrosensis]|uniref:Phenylalanyl-tRNA synthetase alpha chain n=1 Tax=Streptomyces zagrosensis TaxID=1042984 RepID=A0A7W9V1A5_9ACTN|nr:hypothetical protein [Streptomyces zagrosensis]MBB5938985.1 phenylalanyl-tRNA synthetase alpha chain [Streptomyces zagrosensis]
MTTARPRPPCAGAASGRPAPAPGQQTPALRPTPEVAAARCDPGLPPAGPRIGRPHPVSALADRVSDLYVRLGFDVVRLPLLEHEEDNFDLLGYPPDHPTRTRLTFFPAPGIVLRSHASSGILGVLRRAAPGPARALLVATCFRNELASPYSTPQFTQIDGVVVQPDLGLPDLVGLFDTLVAGLFGPEHPRWLRRGRQPYNAPGFALDIACPRCADGCDECSGRGRVEIAAGGVLRDEVLTAGGYRAGHLMGLSFGCSLERLLRLRHGIDDIRELLVNDTRVLEQFD